MSVVYVRPSGYIVSDYPFSDRHVRVTKVFYHLDDGRVILREVCEMFPRDTRKTWETTKGFPLRHQKTLKSPFKDCYNKWKQGLLL